jgi:hypothetical protein
MSNWEGFGDMAEMMRGSYPAGVAGAAFKPCHARWLSIY